MNKFGLVSSPTPRSPTSKSGSQAEGVKLFVGGLTGDTTREDLAQYFSQFAPIIDSFVVYDNKKPSGFGFVTLKSASDADRVMSTQHMMNGSVVDVKPALDKSQAKSKEESDRRRKVFVGGLPKNFPDNSLQKYFEQFGPIQKCYVVKDPITGKTRGFGFVIFCEDEGFEAALVEPCHLINGQEVHIKPATVKEEERFTQPTQPNKQYDKQNQKQTTTYNQQNGFYSDSTHQSKNHKIPSNNFHSNYSHYQHNNKRKKINEGQTKSKNYQRNSHLQPSEENHYHQSEEDYYKGQNAQSNTRQQQPWMDEDDWQQNQVDQQQYFPQFAYPVGSTISPQYPLVSPVYYDPQLPPGSMIVGPPRMPTPLSNRDINPPEFNKNSSGSYKSIGMKPFQSSHQLLQPRYVPMQGSFIVTGTQPYPGPAMYPVRPQPRSAQIIKPRQHLFQPSPVHTHVDRTEQQGKYVQNPFVPHEDEEQEPLERAEDI